MDDLTPRDGGQTPSGRPVVSVGEDVDRLRASLDELRTTLDEVGRGLAQVRSGPPVPATSRRSHGDRLPAILPEVSPPQPTLLAQHDRSSTAPGLPLPDQQAPGPAQPVAGPASPVTGPASGRSPRARFPVALIGIGTVVAAALVALMSVQNQDSPARPGPATTVRTGYLPGIDAAGSQVVVTPGDSAGLAVQESAVVAQPAREVTLARPDLSSVPGLTVTTPDVTGLSATADGQNASITQTADGWVVRSESREPMRQLTLRYTLAQGVVRASGAVEGRALLVVTPLTAQISQDTQAPVLARVSGATVRQATCLAAPQPQQFCGTAGSDGWTARIPPSSTVPLVVFQVDVTG